MLRGNLYELLSFKETVAEVRFSPESVIFAAHFPGKAIVPGACLVEMARELAEQFADRRLSVNKLVNAKFVGIIEPESVKQCRFCFTFPSDCDGRLNFSSPGRVSVLVKDESRLFAKMILEFTDEK